MKTVLPERLKPVTASRTVEPLASSARSATPPNQSERAVPAPSSFNIPAGPFGAWASAACSRSGLAKPRCDLRPRYEYGYGHTAPLQQIAQPQEGKQVPQDGGEADQPDQDLEQVRQPSIANEFVDEPEQERADHADEQDIDDDQKHVAPLWRVPPRL